MSELAIQRPAEIANVLTGELLSTEDTAALVDYLRQLREHKSRVLDEIKAAESYILEEAERQGTKTLRFGAAEVKVYGGAELQWDVEVLEELLAAGLPTHRFTELVSIVQTYKVDARVAKQLESANPTYKGIIERARSYVETPKRVSVR